jgi:hypothetical protein
VWKKNGLCPPRADVFEKIIKRGLPLQATQIFFA